jgi:hypothetical protein
MSTFETTKQSGLVFGSIDMNEQRILVVEQMKFFIAYAHNLDISLTCLAKFAKVDAKKC